MFIELTTRDDIKYLLNTGCIEQVAEDGIGGCLIYIRNDEFSLYHVKESYEYLRNVLLKR